LDFATFSGHKIYAPKGIGAYYVKDKSLITPLLHGGGQEMKLRPGTESVPMIAGLGAAAELCAKNLSAESAGLAEMRVRLEEALRREIEGVVVCAEGADRLPGTSCVCFEGVYGTYVVLDLADEGIAVSSGSACSANKSEPSHVLLAMGMEPEVAQGAVRFSLGRANTPDQIDVVVEKVAEIVQKQRAHPPQLELDIDLLSICD
jgi:cysteine desulfurase